MALSMTRKPPTDDLSWRRVGDVSNAPAFHGTSRGRGRGGARSGGRGGGTGGHASRGDSTANTPSEASNRADLPSKPPSPTTARTSGPAVTNAKTEAPADASATKPRTSRHGSRNTPSLVVDPSVPKDGSANGPGNAPITQPPSSSRRKRSGRKNSKPSPSTQTPSPTVSTRSSVLGSSRGGSKAVLEPQPEHTKVKDLPPHLAGAQPAAPDASTLEVRSNVETLVERMRAVAMQRPSSPGHSHIDWAGDDDDTLPDLDDWGYGPTVDSTSSGLAPPKLRDEVISPILEGSLKALPLLDNTPSNDTPRASAPPVVGEAAELPQVKIDVAGAADDRASGTSATGAPVNSGRPNGLQSASPERLKSRRGVRSRTKDKEPKDRAAKAEAAPKPVGGSGTTSNKEDGPRSTKPASPLQPSVADAKAAPGTQDATPPNPPAAPIDTPSAAAGSTEPGREKSSPVGLAASMHAPSGLAASMHAPSGLAASMHAPSGLAASMHAPADSGLAASMHAPKPSGAQPQSAPSHTTTHPIGDAPRGAPPTHSRSQSRPATRPARANISPSRQTNGRGQGEGGHHNRTQSTPVTPSARGAGGHTRPAHAARPVLTVGALSTIARTLNGGPLGAPARRAEVTTTDK